MKKIILDFYDVIDNMIDENDRPGLVDEKDDTPKDNPGVFLADLPENKVKSPRILIHEYLAEKFGFPSYYGKNLDALYDCLTDICEPTCVGFFYPVTEMEDLSVKFMMYLGRVLDVLKRAERDNPDYLCVIASDESGAYIPDDPDKELEELLYQLKFG